DDTDEIDDTDDEVVRDNGDPGPLGFIGGPCSSNTDCAFSGGTCVSDGYDGGMCSSACDAFCPDESGHPTTFCVDDGDLWGQARSLGQGACHSRCDFGTFPVHGCRTGYACVVAER